MAAEAPGAAVERMLQEHRRAGGCMVVGYSGGADSSLLLALAVRHCPAGINLRALHVNHGLHAQSGDWEEHCRAFADKLGVPIEVVRSRIRAGRGIEDKARQARLRAFAGTDADAIVLAHHADDQIETFLLRALRGAGIRGLA
ncbi:MAG: tRNA lysidine(34) synthetase TilS, partial [Betaproteobacteria bacterium]|nr:tRNA lysidine(34) synthetase TilS [Betaproteobacteria bacterium]